MKVLLIDDLRSEEFVNENWHTEVTDVARTFAEGINRLKANKYDLLLLDHDLACFDEEGNELTGYMVMVFLEEHPEYLPKSIIPITSNPVGLTKMRTVINKIYKGK